MPDRHTPMVLLPMQLLPLQALILKECLPKAFSISCLIPSLYFTYVNAYYLIRIWRISELVIITDKSILLA
jgi:hypothetical protein